MNELKGKFVNIVLSIEEGRGFDPVHSQFYITANFNGRVMESDIMDPHPNIIFNTEMVWEAEKKLLRKARGSYGSVKIECYTVQKKYFGFCLLCLRSAKILPSSRTNLQISYSWVKLLGTPSEFKKSTPELQVSLTIRDYITNKVIPPAIPNFDSVGLSGDNNEQIQIPVKYTKNGYIQVGKDDEQLKVFTFKLTVRTAVNLDLLLPEAIVFSQLPKQYYLLFSIFGMHVKTRQITRDIHENIRINETVVINLLSNFATLRMYFQTFPKMPCYFYNGDTKLGWTEINVDNMGWDIDNAVFNNWCDGKLEFEEENFFESNSLDNLDTNRRPSVVTRCSIEMLNNEIGQGEDANLSARTRFSSCEEGELLLNKQRQIKSARNNLAIIEEQSNPSSVSLLHTEPSTPIAQDDPKNDLPADKYSEFCIAFMLEFIIWKRAQKTTFHTIKFAHPKANTCLQIKTEIEKSTNRKHNLENALCKLMFVSSEANIGKLFNQYSPKIQFVDNREQPISKEFVLDCSKLALNCLEYNQTINLITPNNEELGELHTCIFLEINDLNGNGKATSAYHLLPHIMDDKLIISTIGELEQWKDGERSKFSASLEGQREKELADLHADWAKRKTKLENDLKQNMERCKNLSRDLKKHAYTLNLHKIVEERNLQDKEFNPYMEIHKNSVRYSLCDSHELVEKINDMERENAILKDLLSEQSLEIQDMKQNNLTCEQTQNLLHDLKNLEEKFEEAQKDKLYFKIEYEKAVKEVHLLKLEIQENLKHRIASEKEELSQLSLETFIDPKML